MVKCWQAPPLHLQYLLLNKQAYKVGFVFRVQVLKKKPNYFIRTAPNDSTRGHHKFAFLSNVVSRYNPLLKEALHW